MFWLLLLFTAVPALELYLLLRIGAWLGPAPTVLLILGTGFVGAWLAKREGLAVLRQLSEELKTGLPPGSRLAEGALVVAGGLLLVTPGVITDLSGFAFIFPPTRRLLAPLLVRFLASRFQVSGDASFRLGRPPAVPRDPDDSPFDHPVS